MDQSQVVLIVESDDRVRAALRHAFQARAVPVFEVADAFDAMSALGRADFGAIVVSAGKRQLSVRGLCQLARRRHQGVRIYVITFQGDDPQRVRQSLGIPVDIVVPGTTTNQLAATVAEALLEPSDPFAGVPTTGEVRAAELAAAGELEQTQRIPIARREVTALEADEPTATNFPAPAILRGSATQSSSAPAGEAPLAPSASLLLSTEGTATDAAPSGYTAGAGAMLSDHEPTQVDAPAPPRDDDSDVSTGERSAAGQDPLASQPTAVASPPPALADAIPSDAETMRVTAAPGPMAVADAAPLTDSLDSQTAVGTFGEEDTVRVPVVVPPEAFPTQTPSPAVSSVLAPVPTQAKLPRPIEFTPPSSTTSGFAEATVAPPPASAAPPSAADEFEHEETRPEQRVLAPEAMNAARVALLEGELADEEVAPLLVTLLVQELTGRLIVDKGEGRGALYFYGGEPVWADHPAGDMGLLAALRENGLTIEEAMLTGVPEGQLLSALAEMEVLSGPQLHDFMRTFIRTRILNLLGQQSGGYRFVEDATFLDTAPLLKVNSFGLVLENRRRQTPPDELLRLSTTMEWRYVHPGTSLGPAAPKVMPFVNGANLNKEVTGMKTVKQTLRAMGMDPLMGTLVLLSLEDARVVSIQEKPVESFDNVKLKETTGITEVRPIELPDSDYEEESASQPSAEEQTAVDEVFTLYMRLKPLTLPREVLGVPLDADDAAIRAAYERRMRNLEPKLIPEGSAQQLMASRVNELRAKVQRAFEALLVQSGDGNPGPW